VHPQFREMARTELAEYMGVAAEFVIEDVMAVVEANKSMHFNLSTRYMFFFSTLQEHLPPDVPFAQLKSTIAKKCGLML
jgi:hypothetical protein